MICPSVAWLRSLRPAGTSSVEWTPSAVGEGEERGGCLHLGLFYGCCRSETLSHLKGKTQGICPRPRLPRTDCVGLYLCEKMQEK